MTDKEKAIIMAHTGICMLEGDKFQIFHKYIEDIMGRPIFTHEIGWLEDEIKERSKTDFIALCADESDSKKPNEWIPLIRREPTAEEKAEYLAQNGEELCYMLENEMPLNGQEVLVSIGELVSEDVFSEDAYNFENNDIENVDAWMSLPKAYKQQESEIENVSK